MRIARLPPVADGDHYVVQRIADGKCWHGADRFGGCAAALWFATLPEARTRAEKELRREAWTIRRLNAKGTGIANDH